MKASEIKENLLNNRYDNMFIDLYDKVVHTRR